MDFDIVIVGAGPAGLAFARSLAGTGLRALVVERQPEPAIADPPFDGREIALTHRSASTLRRLGLWDRIPAPDISPLRDARVMDGDSPFAMLISHRDGGRDRLGYLVPNHLIRRAAYQCATATPEVTLRTGTAVTGIATHGERAQLTLRDGTTVQARLVVAADSRYSETRRAVGISARMHDFGRTMLVCNMDLGLPHDQVAWEWFEYGQTLAMLPKNGTQASVVLTLPNADIAQLMQMDPATFSRDITARFKERLGEMTLASTRHAYPLVGVYPSRFTCRRFAVVGDAAVGMHPVTAHGYNFGLVGTELLANAVRDALTSGADIGDAGLLARYDSELRRATHPLYLATRAIATLYTSDGGAARLIRGAALRFGQRFGPFRRMVAGALTGSA